MKLSPLSSILLQLVQDFFFMCKITLTFMSQNQPTTQQIFTHIRNTKHWQHYKIITRPLQYMTLVYQILCNMLFTDSVVSVFFIFHMFSCSSHCLSISGLQQMFRGTASYGLTHNLIHSITTHNL